MPEGCSMHRAARNSTRRISQPRGPGRRRTRSMQGWEEDQGGGVEGIWSKATVAQQARARGYLAAVGDQGARRRRAIGPGAGHSAMEETNGTMGLRVFIYRGTVFSLNGGTIRPSELRHM